MVLPKTRSRRRMRGDVKNIFLLGSIAAGAFMASQPVLAERPIVWVPSSSLVRIAPTEKPRNTTTAIIHAARGETQSFQVAVQARGGDLTNLNFSVSDLASGKRERDASEGVTSDSQIISRANLILYREKYLTVLQHSPT